MSTDKLILRHAYLQQYANGYAERLRKAHDKGDKALIKFLREWIDEASAKDIAAAIRFNHKNAMAKALNETISAILKEQLGLTSNLVLAEMTELIPSQAAVAFEAYDVKPVIIKPASVMMQPVLGQPIAAGWKANAIAQESKLRAAIITALQEDREPHKALKGTKDQNYKDGAFYSRNLSIDRLAETQVNGAANNTLQSVHETFKITKEDYLATLDHRTCPICSAAEMGSPYDVGKGAMPPLHPRCRCIRIGAGLDETRPYVNDERPVKNIPKSERADKIGQTKKSYAEWFDGQTETAKRDILGASRYDLYKNEGVKIKEFTNDAGSLYSVVELDEKYNKGK